MSTKHITMNKFKIISLTKVKKIHLFMMINPSRIQRIQIFMGLLKENVRNMRKRFFKMNKVKLSVLKKVE